MASTSAEGRRDERSGVGTMCFASVFVLIQSEAGDSMRKIGWQKSEG